MKRAYFKHRVNGTPIVQADLADPNIGANWYRNNPE